MSVPCRGSPDRWSQIAQILTTGGHKAKKAPFEALIEETEIQTDDSLIPRFRIPTGETIKGRLYSQPLINYPMTIRFAYRHIWLDQTCMNKNRAFPVQGPDVTVLPVGRRLTSEMIRHSPLIRRPSKAYDEGVQSSGLHGPDDQQVRACSVD